MLRFTTRLFVIALTGFFLVSATGSLAADKGFLGSDDAREKDEPQKFLPDYDKLVKGKDADWVYFPKGEGLKGFKTVTVKEFEENGHGRECRDAAREGKDYMEQWLEKEGFQIVKSGGEVVIEGNVFSAWEPSGAARYWGGWAASPGVGMEVMAKDAKGNILAEIRQKAKGSTPRDAVENGLEDIATSLAKGR
jgi:hypothetical protein